MSTPETHTPSAADRGGDRPAVSDPAGQDPVMTVSQEQLVVGTEWSISGRIRLRRRVVSETRMVEVTLRREELVVDTDQVETRGESFVGTATGTAVTDAPRTDAPATTIVLREEIPQVSVRTRAYEQVTVRTVLVVENARVDSTIRAEHVVVDQGPPTEPPDRP